MKGLTFIKFNKSIQILHAAWATSTPWIPFGTWTYGKETCSCSGADVFAGCAPWAIDLDVRVWYVVVFFYTDGSLIEECAGFAVQMGVGGFGHKIQSPASVFTAELSALFTAVRHIAEVIRPTERCLILIDSMVDSTRSRICCLGKLHIRLTLWCMNVNNCAGACARTKFKWNWCGFHLM
jgi:hypothetical protein